MIRRCACGSRFDPDMDGGLCPHGEPICNECWPGDCERCCEATEQEVDEFEVPC